MKETVKWLAEIEHKAYDVYSKAALYFADDGDFSDFVSTLSAEEKEHYAVIRRAAELIESQGGFDPFTYIDEDRKAHLMECFAGVERAMEAKGLTREEFIECVVYAEFSEWNDLFMYVVNAMKRRFRAFVPVAVGVERHRKSIVRFLERRGGFKASLEAINSLPPLWVEKILVVDDERMIGDLFSVFLSGEGTVECVTNGSEALERLEQGYYAAIISDIDMPVMDGMEFFKRAVDRYPGIEKRFIFFSGRIDRETAGFIDENNLKYIAKPSSIQDIKKAIIGILS